MSAPPVALVTGSGKRRVGWHVADALARAGGNQSQAARILRIGRDALRYKMKKFDLH